MLNKIFGRNNEVLRQKWLHEVLTALPASSTILDAGAGELKNKKNCTHLIYTSQDICQYEGKGDGVALHTGAWDTSKIDIISDIINIPVVNESYDVVLCTEVLEHVPDPYLALKELSRIVKVDGQLIITAPFCSLTHFAPHHYSTGLSQYWFIKHLTSLGFADIKIIASGSWPEYIAQELWRMPWIGKSYTHILLGLFGLIFSLPVLLILRLMKVLDRRSDELLCFGLHVTANKK